MKIGKIMMLKEWMQKNRWNANAFAKKIGVTRLTIKNLMERKSEPTLRLGLLIHYATDCEVSLQELIIESKK